MDLRGEGLDVRYLNESERLSVGKSSPAARHGLPFVPNLDHEVSIVYPHLSVSVLE